MAADNLLERTTKQMLESPIHGTDPNETIEDVENLFKKEIESAFKKKEFDEEEKAVGKLE